jgi:hypothetical protein
MNKLLLGTAKAHSLDMYNKNYFDHTDPNGITAFQRMTNAGYNYVSAGENMAAGTGMSATALEDFMMVDPGTSGRLHRVNLLDIFTYPPPAYLEVGVGYYQGSNSNSIGNSFITEDFGTSATAGPFLLGVVYDANGNNFYDIGEGIPGVTITPSGGNYYAISSSAGGYAIPMGTSGTITVTASGGGFGPITKTITLTGTNIKLDFTPRDSSTTVTTFSQSVTQTTSQSATQTQTTSQLVTQTTSSITTQTSFQSLTQTSSTSTVQPLFQSVTFQSAPSNFANVASPGTITACGSTYANSQSATACGMSFGATANLPTPSTGWQFNHWTWAGGVACSSDTANPASCAAYNSGGVLIAVYAAQVNIVTNPASSALVGWSACSDQALGNGASFFSTNFGSTSVTTCNLPSGYSFSSWTCSGGLACSATANPTTVTFTGPGTITLNLQTQTLTNTSTSTSTTSSAASSTVSTVSTSMSTSTSQTIPVSSQMTTPPMPGFPWESIIAGMLLGMTALVIVRRRRK